MSLDKQKLLAWLDQSAKNNALSQAVYAINDVIKGINEGAFDSNVDEVSILEAP